MSAEFWAVIGVGISLGTLVLISMGRSNVRLDKLDARMNSVEKEVSGLAASFRALQDRVDRIEVYGVFSREPYRGQN